MRRALGALARVRAPRRLRCAGRSAARAGVLPCAHVRRARCEHAPAPRSGHDLRARTRKRRLLATLDRCKTAMGSRLLARWIVAPLVDRDGDRGARRSRRGARRRLSGARGAARVARRRVRSGAHRAEGALPACRYRAISARCGARWRCSNRCARRFRPHLRRTRSASGDHRALHAQLEATLCDDLPATLADGGVIRPDASPDVSECVAQRAAGARAHGGARRARTRRGPASRASKSSMRARSGTRSRSRNRTWRTFRPTTCASKR